MSTAYFTHSIREEYIHTHTHIRLCVFIRVHTCVRINRHTRVYKNIGGSTSLCGCAVCIVSVCFTSLVTTFCLVFSFQMKLLVQHQRL